MKTDQIKSIFPEDIRDFASSHHESDYVLVDVRLAEEYTQEHIPGAKLLPLHEIEARLGELDPQKKTVFYCRSGKRSMAAATLARDSGLFSGQILNLEGGISAYADKVLPEFPRIDIFYDAASLKDVLSKAIALEKGAHSFYQTFLGRIKDEAMRKQVKILADLEVAHAKVLFRQGRDLFDKDFEAFFAESEDSAVEGGLDVKAWTAQLDRIHDRDLCMYFLELALEVETMAYDMYRSLAEKDYPREAVDCFFRLSEQEKSHIRIVANIFKECSN